MKTLTLMIHALCLIMFARVLGFQPASKTSLRHWMTQDHNEAKPVLLTPFMTARKPTDEMFVTLRDPEREKEKAREKESYSLFSKPSYSFFRQTSPQANLFYLIRELSVMSQVQRDSSLEYYFSRMQNQVQANRQRILVFVQRRLLMHNNYERKLQQRAQNDLTNTHILEQHARLVDFLHSSLPQEQEKRRQTLAVTRRERRQRRRKLFILSTWLEDVLPDPSQGKSWMMNMAVDSLKITARTAQLLLSVTKIVPKPKVFEGLE